jgi:hypothetical protein
MIGGTLILPIAIGFLAAAILMRVEVDGGGGRNCFLLSFSPLSTTSLAFRDRQPLLVTIDH